MPKVLTSGREHYLYVALKHELVDILHASLKLSQLPKDSYLLALRVKLQGALRTCTAT